MKFSIVIPVYKTEKYLNKCVDSVLSQSFKDFELVLVDNESPDNCPKICENYAKMDSRVRVIHKTHGTAASGRNMGMKSAKGEYLCFLDSDDWWVDDEVLSKINERIEKSGADIIELYYKSYFESTDSIVMQNPVDFTGFDQLANDKKIEFLIAHDRLNPSAWGMCISREYLESCNGYFDEGKIIEDIDWCLRLYSKNPKVDALADAIYVYRVGREGSVTRTMRSKSIFDLLEIIENAPNILSDEKNLTHQAMMNYVTYQAMINSALTYRRSVELTSQQKKEVRQRLKAFSKKYLKKYPKHPKVKKAVKMYKLLGYSGMAWVLGFYLNNRRRFNLRLNKKGR